MKNKYRIMRNAQIKRNIIIFKDKETLLFQSDLNKKTGIDLSYDNKKVQGNILYTEYVIFITENPFSEISNSSDYLIMTLPEGFYWRDIETYSPFEEVSISCSIDGQNAKVEGNFNLNRNIVFRIHLVIEKENIEESENESLSDIFNDLGILRKINIEHNIENIGKVQKKVLVFSNNLDDFAYAVPIVFLFPMIVAYFFNIHNVFIHSFWGGVISMFFVMGIMVTLLPLIYLYINHFQQRFYFKGGKDFFN